MPPWPETLRHSRTLCTLARALRMHTCSAPDCMLWASSPSSYLRAVSTTESGTSSDSLNKSAWFKCTAFCLRAASRSGKCNTTRGRVTQHYLTRHSVDMQRLSASLSACRRRDRFIRPICPRGPREPPVRLHEPSNGSGQHIDQH